MFWTVMGICRTMCSLPYFVALMLLYRISLALTHTVLGLLYVEFMNYQVIYCMMIICRTSLDINWGLCSPAGVFYGKYTVPFSAGRLFFGYFSCVS